MAAAPGTAEAGARAWAETNRAARALARGENGLALVLDMRARRLGHRSTVHAALCRRLDGQLDPLDTASIVTAMERVEGWLTAGEAGMLARAAATASAVGNVVEIGSYCGRSTVTLALALARASPDRRRRLIAIDPHEGYDHAGDRDTYAALTGALRANAVDDVVDVVRARSTDVQLDPPVGMVFIDGLHDAHSVRADRDHAAGAVGPGGLLAFHDYRPDFTGVVDAVDEILLGATFRLAALAGSLVVLRRAS